MNWKVNPKTLCFEDLGGADRQRLLVLCSRIVQEGYVDLTHPAFVAWCEAAKYDGRQGLLCWSTSFPQRALLSLALTVPSVVVRCSGSCDGLKVGSHYNSICKLDQCDIFLGGMYLGSFSRDRFEVLP